MKTNILIHKFMGKPDHIMPELMKYHFDWGWLMPVVEKIETLTVKGKSDINNGERVPIEWQFSVEITNNQCMIHRDVSPQYYGTETDFLKQYDCRNKSKVKQTYKTVVAFIKWFNKEQAAHGSVATGAPLKNKSLLKK